MALGAPLVVVRPGHGLGRGAGCGIVGKKYDSVLKSVIIHETPIDKALNNSTNGVLQALNY